uniref:Reverse transcriptase domain-containing protein n=1 Tax=Trichogramma kaykai TaxID=54128 RepID=A0ABD2WA71_9HYME
MGHISRDCPQKIVEKKVEDKRVSKNKQKISIQEKPKPRCFKCYEIGHIAPKCPTSERNKNVVAPAINHVLCKTGNRSCIYGTVGGEKIRCQIDSGADRNVMRNDFYDCIAAKYALNDDFSMLQGSGGVIYAVGSVSVPTKLGGTTYNLTYTVVNRDCLPSKILIGDPLLDVAEIKLHRDRPVVEPLVGDDYVLLIEQELKEDPIEIAASRVPESQRARVREILQNYSSSTPTETSLKMHITVKNPKPIANHPRRLSPAEKVKVREQIDVWVCNGIVKPGASEYAAPLVVAWRKDGRIRVCIDYKRLNNVVERDHNPLPLIEDAVDATAGSVVHSVMDLKDGFFHIDVAEDSQKYLAFVTPWGQYIPSKALFGFCNSPPVFQRYIRQVFQPLTIKGLIVIYMDDLFIKASNEEEAFERLHQVLELAGAHGLKFNWKKCVLLQRRVEFLGYMINEGTITPASGKIETLITYPTPSTQKQVQRFLGLSSYFRKFIFRYAEIAKPLSDMLR